MRGRHSKLVIVVAASSLAASCGKLKDAAKAAEDALFEEPPYEAVPGEDATKHLQVVPGAAPFDPKALSQAMDVGAGEASKETMALRGFPLTADDEKVAEVDGTTLDLMTAGADQKDGLQSEAFQQPSLDTIFKKKTQAGLLLTEQDMDGYDPASDAIDAAGWGDKSEYVVTTLNRVSIKDQGQRGTCAAHAGISQIEYLIMKKHGSELASVDLSEQRFYMMSKPDLWESGGGTVDQDGGSSWTTGMETSFGSGGKTSPTDNAPLNIPTEDDCPYVNHGEGNEIQIPQLAACKRGAVKVKNMTETYFTKSGDGPWTMVSTHGPRTAQEIFNFIKTNDLPVPVGTVLTENWMDNDGMITYAKSAQPGYGPHAGGHAYLIVGMRKLDEAQFPGEGGMCFIIRNSWGTGWGVNGFSCMTLKWFNTYRSAMSFDLALDVDVDLDYLKAHAQGTVPASTTPAAPAAPAAGEKEAAPVAQNTDDPGKPAGGTPATGPGGEPAPAAAQTTADGFTVGRLATKDGKLVQVLFKSAGSNFTLRGVYDQKAGVTQDLNLVLEGTLLKADDDQHHKLGLVVGEVQNDLVTLCSGKYALTCHLNLIPAENKLVVGVTETEFRNYEPNPDADYTTLFDLANYGVQYSLEGIYSDVRLTLKGQPTNPVRLAVKPVSGAIIYRGREIGNYQKGAFCSGEFGAVCRLLVNQQDKTLKIFFKAKKKQ